MSKLGDIRAAIVAKLAGIAEIGKVHAFERYLKENSKLRELYVYGDRIQGWNVRRISKAETSQVMPRTRVVNTWVIRGFMSLSDEAESELMFDALIESICDAFRDDLTLGGVVEDIILEDGTAGIQVKDSGPVMFCGVLCHAAKLELNTVHFY